MTKPKIGEIWVSEFSRRENQYYIILDELQEYVFTTMQIGTGIIQTRRLIDWQNPLWSKVA